MKAFKALMSANEHVMAAAYERLDVQRWSPESEALYDYGSPFRWCFFRAANMREANRAIGRIAFAACAKIVEL